MSRLQEALNQLENRLRVLIEGSAERIFPSGSLREDLAHKLVVAMHEETKADQEGNLVAPNLYTLLLPPQQAQALQGNPQLLDDVAHSLEDYARRAGLNLPGKPMIKVIATSADQSGGVRVLAGTSPQNLGETAQFEIAASGETPAIPAGAFLIIHGEEIVPLSQAVVNLGRGDGNDLVLPELQVSREHAQLRAVRGRYMIFDLDSTGGTFVNGIQITQQELTPGDLISLAGVSLIYGQEQPDMVEETQELGDFNPNVGSNKEE